MPSPHTGRCFCGQVHVTMDADPIGRRACWCRDCQYIASGSATVNVLFPEAAVTFTGEVARLEKVADSGNTVERGFCPVCGSQMYSRTVEPKGQPIRIRAGTLDDPELLAPQALIWVDSAPKWAMFDPAIPHHAMGPTSPLVERKG
jgi:hypothetical protein